jgi:hypothetical protein
MKDDSFRYFTSEEVATIIKEEKPNQYDIWAGYLKLSEDEQKNIFNDKSILNKLTSIVNNCRTVKLLETYYTLKNHGELVDYTVDLEDAFYKLANKHINELEESFSNTKERDAWILIQSMLIGKPQLDIESELAVTDYKLSQRQISQVIRKNISKLTSLLMDI